MTVGRVEIQPAGDLAELRCQGQQGAGCLVPVMAAC